MHRVRRVIAHGTESGNWGQPVRTWKFWALVAFASTAFGGTLESGVFMVDGKPFFPLASWHHNDTTVGEVVALGMNAAHRIVGGDSVGHAFMRDTRENGIQVMVYVPAGTEPLPPAYLNGVISLTEYGNVLVWCVGDDLAEDKLPGLSGNVTALREATPGIPTMGDFWITDPELAEEFDQYTDINSQYSYPIPERSLDYFRQFFAEQRRIHGDPIWTYIQNFQSGGDGLRLNIGLMDGAGPVPDPEQVRLMAYLALNSGVRGITFFSHRGLSRLPELAAEVALFCREARLINEHIAGGALSDRLACSDPDLDAVAFTYQDEVVVSAALAREHYHRWIDAAVVEDVAIDVPWTGSGLPRAALIDMPELVECVVEPGREAGTVRLTVPRLEIAGFILLTTDDEHVDRLARDLDEQVRLLAPLAVTGAASQSRKVVGTLYTNQFDYLYTKPTPMLEATRAVRGLPNLLMAGEWSQVVSDWRRAMRIGRESIDTLMDFAIGHENAIPPAQRGYLESPHSLFNIRNLARAPDPDTPWRFVPDYLIAGPFPLLARAEDIVETEKHEAPGFTTPYPPESDPDARGRFETVDGPGGWRTASADIIGMLDLLPQFGTTENVIAYTRCVVTAPRDMDATMKWGTNDGARLWVNGDLILDEPGGRWINLRALEAQQVQLREGPNVFLAKVENFGRNWRVYLSFEDPDRELVFSTD